MISPNETIDGEVITIILPIGDRATCISAINRDRFYCKKERQAMKRLRNQLASATEEVKPCHLCSTT